MQGSWTGDVLSRCFLPGGSRAAYRYFVTERKRTCFCLCRLLGNARVVSHSECASRQRRELWVGMNLPLLFNNTAVTSNHCTAPKTWSSRCSGSHTPCWRLENVLFRINMHKVVPSFPRFTILPYNLFNLCA